MENVESFERSADGHAVFPKVFSGYIPIRRRPIRRDTDSPRGGFAVAVGSAHRHCELANEDISMPTRNR